MYAEDRIPGEAYVVFITDPLKAMDNWIIGRFDDLADWGREGFPGVYKSRSDSFWILSPDSKGG